MFILLIDIFSFICLFTVHSVLVVVIVVSEDRDDETSSLTLSNFEGNFEGAQLACWSFMQSYTQPVIPPSPNEKGRLAAARLPARRIRLRGILAVISRYRVAQGWVQARSCTVCI